MFTFRLTCSQKSNNKGKFQKRPCIERCIWIERVLKGEVETKKGEGEGNNNKKKSLFLGS